MDVAAGPHLILGVEVQQLMIKIKNIVWHSWSLVGKIIIFRDDIKIDCRGIFYDNFDDN